MRIRAWQTWLGSRAFVLARAFMVRACVPALALVSAPNAVAVPFTIIDTQAPPAGERRIILSFDDGPVATGGVSAALLDVLDRHAVQAVFFFLGRNVAAHPELAHRASEAGHQLAVHGWDSEWPQWSDTDALREEIARARRAIEDATGVLLAGPVLYRPPRGIVTPAVGRLRDDCEIRLGHLTFYARDSGADAGDAERVMARIRAGLQKHAGGAIVLHSSRYRADPAEDDRVDKRWLPDAIDALITWARGAGFTFTGYDSSGDPACRNRT